MCCDCTVLYKNTERLSRVCLTANQTYLYDVVLRVARIETPREGELDDVIALYVFETVAVLLTVHNQAAIRLRPSVLQSCRGLLEGPCRWRCTGLLTRHELFSPSACTQLSQRS